MQQLIELRRESLTHRPAALRAVVAAALSWTLGLASCGGGDENITPPDNTAMTVQGLRVDGPIAVTPTSYPFARARNVDLAARGYEELEYFISGKANVYQWNAAGTAAEVKTEGAPYTNRIIVIRPKDPAKANGKVMVDILNATNGWDFNKTWAVMHDHLLDEGWTYVGVTSKPLTVLALKVFDPVRYQAISWANPLPASDPANCAASNLDQTTENGLLWDILTQLGALVKSKQANSPLSAYGIHAAYLEGFSQSGANVQTYANAIHPLAKLSDGSPVWDGYLQVSPAGITPLNQCDKTVISAEDPRYKVLPRSVPFIEVVGAKDVLTNITSYPRRRDDSDDPADRFRLYEVPGGSHSWAQQLAFNVDPADVAKAGFSNANVAVPDNCTVPEPNDFPEHYVMNASLDALDRWAIEGTAPVRFDRLEIDTSTGTPAYIYDADGNLKGGYRTTYVDVPAAAYVPTNSSGCANWGHVERFPTARLQSLYVNQSNYVSKVNAMLTDMLSAKTVTPGDAQRILTEVSGMSF